MKIQFGNKIRVGDPCYEPGHVSMDAYVEFPAVAGIWDCDAEIVPDSWGSQGNRVASVSLRAVDGGIVTSRRYFDLDVDSGQMAFESVEVQRGGEYDEEGYYGDACRLTLNEDYGVFNSAKREGHAVFVTSTGYGDGCYRLSVGVNEAGEAVSLKMEFIEEDEEEVCERCGDSIDYCWCGAEDEEE